MPAESISFLNRDIFQGAAPDLAETIYSWLKQKNPVALLHPHGFFVIPLLRNEIEEWRFHIWPMGHRQAKGMPAYVHTHDLHIDSMILQGELTNIMYDVSITSKRGYPLYEVSYEGDKYSSETSNVLRKTSTRVQITPTSRQVVKCADAYHITSHSYHEALVSKEMVTSTLVCMHTRSSGSVKVVGLDGYPDSISFKRTAVQTSKILSLLAR